MTEWTRRLAFVSILVFSIRLLSVNKADVDLWGNAGFVKAPAWSADFLRTNTFSYTDPDRTWINHEWLAQYAFHVVHSSLGNAGLLALKIALGLCLVALMHRTISARCGSAPIRYLYLLLTLSTVSYGFSTRPHLFTYLFLALAVFTLRTRRTFPPLLIACVPVFSVLWTNLHGAFFVGALLLGIFALLEAALRRDSARLDGAPVSTLFAVAVLFVAATFVNPCGWRLWAFILDSATHWRPYLSEWAPFNPAAHSLEHPDFLALAALALLSLCLSRRPKDPAWTALLAISFIAALLMRRNIPLFAITAAAVVPEHLDDAAAAPLQKIASRIPPAFVAAALSFFAAVSAWYACFYDKTDPLQIEIPHDRFPVSTLSFMEANRISGNALFFFDWAEYGIWKLYPRCRFFLDGRFSDAYRRETIEDFFNFLYLGDNWENALADYDTDIVLIHRGNPVYDRMAARPGWAVVHTNDIAGLFLKESKHEEFMTRLRENMAEPGRADAVSYFP